MARIEIHDEGSFISFRVSGILTAEDCINTTRDHYPQCHNRDKLWDFSDADLSQMGDQQLTEIATAVRSIVKPGVSPKTAFVTNQFPAYALLTRYLLAAFKSQIHAEYRVFSDIDEARAWFREG